MDQFFSTVLFVTAPTTSTVPSLEPWIDTVRAVVDTGAQGGSAAAGVRAALARRLSDSRAVADLVAELQAEARRHPARVLAQHVEPDGTFTVQAFRWPPGWATSVHDHVAWGAAAVLLGAEHERLYRVEGDTAVLRARRIVAAGECTSFAPPHDVHQVSTPEPTLSLHVYGADLSLTGSSTRRRYDESH